MVSRTILFALAAIACTATADDLSGLHDFDLRVGEWQAHHRLLKERLAGSDNALDPPVKGRFEKLGERLQARVVTA
jgi:hypothetical protein